MEYKHPKQYIGIKFNTERKQIRTRAIVEEYCLKCDLFMGKEHDFSECRISDLWSNGKVIRKKTCPFDNVAVPVDNEELIKYWIKCKVED